MNQNLFLELHASCRWGSDPVQYVKYLGFTDYSSYMAWVGQWKLTYKELSQKIREQRAQYRASQSKGDPDWIISSSLQQNQRFARGLLCLRHDGKFKSWQLKQAAKVTA